MNQCNQEVRDGFSTERNPVKDCILDEGTKFGLCSRYDCCSGTLRLPSGFRPGSWFLLASPGAWFPVFVFACGSCSESEDSLNLQRIQHSNSLCKYVSFFSSLNFEFTIVQFTLSITVCSCTLPTEQVSPVRQILFRGAMAPTLLPVRPGPHLTNVGLLCVCHCHCHCHPVGEYVPTRHYRRTG